MLNKNAQKLVKALRSGNYKQTNERLRYGNAYCCLGVGCKIYTRLGWQKLLSGHYIFMKNEFVLPNAVSNWLNFTWNNGSFTLNDKIIKFLSSKGYNVYNNEASKDYRSSLSSLNDFGIDFDTIASIIEMEPEGLFVN